MLNKRRKRLVVDADSNGSATEMKPIRKIQTVKEVYPTFVTPETLQDLLYVHWSSMKVIKDDDEVEINFSLPAIIPVTIRIKKGKGRTKFRMLNDET